MPYCFAFNVRFNGFKGYVVFIFSNFPKLTTANIIADAWTISFPVLKTVSSRAQYTQSGWLSGIALIILVHIYLAMQF